MDVQDFESCFGPYSCSFLFSLEGLEAWTDGAQVQVGVPLPAGLVYPGPFRGPGLDRHALYHHVVVSILVS